MAYRHTQKGTVIRVGLIAGFTIVLATQISAGWDAGALIVMAILGICLLIFSSLTVAIEGDFLLCQFGPLGIIQKRIPLYEIITVKTVRNSWLAGWGVRWLGGKTTMWNVSGLDAVEVKFKSGRKFRIGTDQPEELAQALQSAVRSYK